MACGKIELIMNGQRITIEPACIEASFGTGGYVFCDVQDLGCELSGKCQVT